MPQLEYERQCPCGDIESNCRNDGIESCVWRVDCRHISIQGAVCHNHDENGSCVGPFEFFPAIFIHISCGDYGCYATDEEYVLNMNFHQMDSRATT